MAKRDYYEVLGVTRGCDDGALKAAFRKLAMQCHPDRNPGDHQSEVRFKELNEAYDVLKDGDKRAAYDRFGHAAFESGSGHGAGFGADFASTFHDIFDDLFGMGRRGGACIPALFARYRTREVGGGRATRQPGQVRKEAALTSYDSGRSSASHYHCHSGAREARARNP